jgi:hypothetical protein
VRVGRHETDGGVVSLDIRELEIRDMSKLLQGVIEGKKLKGKATLTLRMSIMGWAACNFFPISKISNYAGAPPLGTGIGLI